MTLWMCIVCLLRNSAVDHSPPSVLSACVLLLQARVVHCNLHLGAIFVSEKTWLWKVAGMEAACAVDKLDTKVPVHTCACVVCYTHGW